MSDERKTPLDFLREGYAETEQARAKEQAERNTESGIGDADDVINEAEPEIENPLYLIARGFAKLNKRH
ncbi:hypothetical protein MO973_09165 [Paenibacillus sp. TRM 82003]|nr:hypothetical protein [Paenibacillus sp. TRM 82003]